MKVNSCKGKQQIIFVLTFGSITQRVLPLIEEKKNRGEIIIVTSTKQLETFFKENTDFKVISTKVHPDLINRKTIHKLLLNIIFSKLEYARLFREIKDSEIYFSNKACAIVIFSYIKKLSKSNKVFFFESQLEKKSMNFPIDRGLRAFAMRLIAKWIFGIETIIYNRSGMPYWNLKTEFFKDVSKIKISNRSSMEINNKYIKKMEILKNKRILIVYNDSISCGFIEKKGIY